MERKIEAWDERSNGRITAIKVSLDYASSTKPWFQEATRRRLFICLEKWLVHCRSFELHAHVSFASEARVCMRGQAVELKELYADDFAFKALVPRENTSLRVLDLTKTFTKENSYSGATAISSCLPAIDQVQQIRKLVLNRHHLLGYLQSGVLGTMNRVETFHVAEHVYRNCPVGGYPRYPGPEGLPNLPSLEWLRGSPACLLGALACPNLTSLEIGPGCNCEAAVITQIFNDDREYPGFSPGKIAILRITQGVHNTSLSAILPRMTKLYWLYTEQCVSNETVEALTDAAVNPCLHTIHIRDARSLTGTPLMRMVSNRLPRSKTSTSGNANVLAMDTQEVSQIYELHLSMCDLLEKEAEEWLKRNVPRCRIERIKPQAPASYRDRMAYWGDEITLDDPMAVPVPWLAIRLAIRTQYKSWLYDFMKERTE
jgi:hypothetical protein